MRTLGVDFLKLRDLALELEVHPTTIRRYIDQGKIDAVKVGKCYVISKENFEKFLNGNTRQRITENG